MPIIIRRCQFSENTAQKNTIQLFFAELVEITDSRFLSNTALSASKGLFVGSSNVNISYCNFQDNTILNFTSKAQKLSYETYGSFINAIISSNITVIESRFLDGIAKMGGAIYLSGGKIVYFIQFLNYFCIQTQTQTFRAPTLKETRLYSVVELYMHCLSQD